jgi:hypothetical protein
MTIENKEELFHFQIRTSKDYSHFIYFTLESNEGLCFYSTKEHQVGDQTRTIDIYGPLVWKANVGKNTGTIKSGKSNRVFK